jgi:hypothetical protein
MITSRVERLRRERWPKGSRTVARKRAAAAGGDRNAIGVLVRLAIARSENPDGFPAGDYRLIGRCYLPLVTLAHPPTPATDIFGKDAALAQIVSTPFAYSNRAMHNSASSSAKTPIRRGS